MSASPEELEARMAELRARLREAVRARDRAGADRIRRELRQVEDSWNRAVDAEADDAGEAVGEAADNADGPTAVQEPPHRSASTPAAPNRLGLALPVREQVHQSLTILGAPASPKLISAAYEAFFTDPLVPSRLASLRRDEERSFTAQGHSRPYYICAALTYDRLTPARGLLAVSTWSLERRVIGPLSPRADFLAHAARVAGQIERMCAAGHEPAEAAWRLLRRFAFNIPGAYDHDGHPDPARVIAAARAESQVHTANDESDRRGSAAVAREKLSDAQQLFGVAPLGEARTVSETTP
ncbi:hypothetical protein ACGFMO_15335 [Streptomyces niveus]|jgi:hypothetical protein|uniref:hypothetical protein n=1 Tax=Streptomyces niveus TaxID=193462 RepID=UPI0037162DBF